jgi:hypothetical protein
MSRFAGLLPGRAINSRVRRLNIPSAFILLFLDNPSPGQKALNEADFTLEPLVVAFEAEPFALPTEEQSEARD